MSNVFYKDDKEYPELLKQIGKDAPKQLYYKTRSSHLDIFENCLTVIGSRKLTSYGKQVIEQLVGEIAMSGITIVSGFMYGGDAAAHQAAVKVGGRTIAVMPCGIDRISPEDQEELYQDILENNGLIVSEYEGDMAPALWSYPRRNRIAAGLSKALLIVEAGEKSGCLITANYAKKFNRKIFVAPGPITSSVSKGSNMLIKEGAEMVLSAKDVLKYYQNRSSRSKSYRPRLDEYILPSSEHKDVALKARPMDEKQILDLLEREPMGIDELSRKLEISSSELGVKLSMMEIKGLIKLRGNKYGIN